MRERHGAKRAKAEKPGAGNTPDARLNLSRIMRGVGTPKPFSFLFHDENTLLYERRELLWIKKESLLES